MALPRFRFLSVAMLACVACAPDEFDGTGSVEQSSGLTCEAGASCTGSGAVYTAVLRVGASALSRSEFVQVFTAAGNGTPQTARIPIRHLRPFFVPLLDALGEPQTPPVLNVAILPVVGGVVNEAASPIAVGSVALTATASGGFRSSAFPAGVATITFEAGATPLVAGESYALAIMTDDVPANATGSLLLGLGALVNVPTDPSLLARQRTTRRASTADAWRPVRLRPAAFSVALEVVSSLEGACGSHPPCGAGLDCIEGACVDTSTADGSPVMLSGIVRNAAGAPLPGLRVQGSGPSASSTADTEAAGAFTLQVPSGMVSLQIYSQTLDGRAFHLPERFSFSGSVWVPGDRSIVLTTPPTHTITVHVEDPLGAPIASAQVYCAQDQAAVAQALWAGGPAFAIGQSPAAAGPTTDANGDAQFWGFTMAAIGPLYADWYDVDGGVFRKIDWDSTLLADANVTIVVDNRVVTLSGTLTNATGTPLPGAQVTGGSAAGGNRNATTDENGQFSLRITPGDVSLLIASGSNDFSGYGLPQWFQFSGGFELLQDEDLAITLPATTEITAHAENLAGTPIVGAQIYGAQQIAVTLPDPFWPGGPSMSGQQSPAAGGYPTNAAGNAVFYAFDTPNYAPVYCDYTDPQGTLFRQLLWDLSAPEDAQLAFVLDTVAIHVSGTITNAGGTPLPGLSVQVALGGGQVSATTDVDGSFTVRTPRGTGGSLLVQSSSLDGRTAQLPEWFSFSGPLDATVDTNLALALPPTHLVTVHVTDTHAAPVVGAQVYTSQQEQAAPAPIQAGGPDFTFGQSASASPVYTDATGTATFRSFTTPQLGWIFTTFQNALGTNFNAGVQAGAIAAPATFELGLILD